MLECRSEFMFKGYLLY